MHLVLLTENIMHHPFYTSEYRAPNWKTPTDFFFFFLLKKKKSISPAVFSLLYQGQVTKAGKMGDCSEGE